jgi:hypothetical protein
MPRKTNTPSISQWKQLYELMGKVRELAPWEFMYEHEVFAVQFPETGRLGLVSVMGTLGEHFSIAVYLDKKGIEGFERIQKLGDKFTTEELLQIPQLQASFEDREMITPEDREILKQLGLKFRGKKSWPQFRSYHPACIPWYLEQEEAQMLIHGLEQLLDVAPRFRDDPSLLKAVGMNSQYLVRVQADGKWRDEKRKVSFPVDPPLNIHWDGEALANFKAMQTQNMILEMDVSMMMEGVMSDEFERPFFPFVLTAVDQDSGMILGMDLLTPLPSLEEMWAKVPSKVIALLADQFKPREIQVTDPLLYQLLEVVGQQAGISVKQVKRLPQVQRVQRGLKQFRGHSY